MKREVRILICVLFVCLTTVALFGCAKNTADKGNTPDQQNAVKPTMQKPITDEEIDAFFEMEENEEGYTIKKYIAKEPQVELPSRYKKEIVTKLGDKAFGYKSEIQKVVIPDSIEEIGSSAFEDCKNLESVTLNEGLKEIGRSSFEGTAIQTLTIPKTVTLIGKRAFKNCSKLESASLNDGLKNIGNEIFINTKIKSILVPNTVVQIEKGAITDEEILVDELNPKYEARGNCIIEKATHKIISGGKASVIPSDIKVIGKEAFVGSKIEIIEIPSNIETIEEEAFLFCEDLKILRFNEGLKEIGKGAFSCTSIKSLTAPSTLRTIGESAFRACYILKHLHLGYGVRKIGNGAFINTGLESVEIPDNVEEVGGAFADINIKTNDWSIKYEVKGNCLMEKYTKKIVIAGKDFVIPSDAKTIGERAFANSSIEKIEIPSTIETIESEAFINCKYLKEIILNEGLKEIGKDVFSETNIKSITIPSTVEKLCWLSSNRLNEINLKVRKSYYESHKDKFPELEKIGPEITVNWING